VLRQLPASVLLALILPVGLGGCGDDDGPVSGADGGRRVDAGECNPGYGWIRTCVYQSEGSMTPSENATVTMVRGPMDVPFESRTDATGCTEEEVEVDTWNVSAENMARDCFSDTETVTVDECGTVEVTLYVDYACVG